MSDLQLIDFVPQYNDRGEPLIIQAAKSAAHPEELKSDKLKLGELFVDPELAKQKP